MKHAYFQGTKDCCIVCIHGGAWIIGSPNKIKEECFELQKAGYHVVAPHYSLVPSAKLYNQSIVLAFAAFMISFSLTSNAPTIMFFITFTALVIIWLLIDQKEDDIRMVDEIIDTVRYASANYSPNVLLLGHSAGAHLAALVSCRLTNEIAGCICLSGVYSGKRLESTGVGQMLIRAVFNENVTSEMPINQVTSKAPPHFLINASWDWDLALHAQDYAAWLLDNGVYVRHRYFDGNHFSLHKHWSSKNSHIRDEVIEFIEECLERRYLMSKPNSQRFYNRK